MRDIAVKTGYSVNTVSRALRDKDGVSECVRQFIKETAASLGYVPNGVARSLRLQSTRTIQVVMGDLSNPYFGIAAQSIEKTARSRGYNVLIANTEEDYRVEDAAIRTGLEKNVDGFIIFPVQQKCDDIKVLRERNVPFVLLGRYFPELHTDSFVSDDVAGGYIATRHLIDNGHRDILLLNGPPYLSCAQERHRGYERALAEAGLPYRPELVLETPVRTGKAFETLQEWLNGGEAPHLFTAVFAFSDLMALEAISCLREHGYDVPNDVSVIGYDDIQHSLHIPYDMTSVRIPIARMGREATECLLTRIEGHVSQKPCHKVYPGELVVRRTTRSIQSNEVRL